MTFTITTLSGSVFTGNASNRGDTETGASMCGTSWHSFMDTLNARLSMHGYCTIKYA